MSGDVSVLKSAELELDAALSALDALDRESGLFDSADGGDVASLIRPHIRLFTETLLVNRGDALRPDYQDLEAPVIELSFEYPGARVKSNSASPSFAAHGCRMRRDVAAETRGGA